MAATAGAEARFCWVRREHNQDADGLRKFVDDMDFGLKYAMHDVTKIWPVGHRPLRVRAQHQHVPAIKLL